MSGDMPQNKTKAPKEKKAQARQCTDHSEENSDMKHRNKKTESDSEWGPDSKPTEPGDGEAKGGIMISSGGKPIYTNSVIAGDGGDGGDGGKDGGRGGSGEGGGDIDFSNIPGGVFDSIKSGDGGSGGDGSGGDGGDGSKGGDIGKAD